MFFTSGNTISFRSKWKLIAIQPCNKRNRNWVKKKKALLAFSQQSQSLSPICWCTPTMFGLAGQWWWMSPETRPMNAQENCFGSRDTAPLNMGLGGVGLWDNKLRNQPVSQGRSITSIISDLFHYSHSVVTCTRQLPCFRIISHIVSLF